MGGVDGRGNTSVVLNTTNKAAPKTGGPLQRSKLNQGADAERLFRETLRTDTW